MIDRKLLVTAQPLCRSEHRINTSDVGEKERYRYSKSLDIVDFMITFTTHSVDFKPNQIVCLEQVDSALYAEVIQSIPQRQRCWVRPRWLVIADAVYALDDRAPDLLWPSQDFRVAFDQEVLPLVSEPLTPHRSAEGSQQLQEWVRRFKQMEA